MPRDVYRAPVMTRLGWVLAGSVVVGCASASGPAPSQAKASRPASASGEGSRSAEHFSNRPIVPEVRSPDTQPETQPEVVQIGRALLLVEEAERWRREIVLSRPAPPRVVSESSSSSSGEAASLATAFGQFSPLVTIPFGKSHLTFANISPDGSWVVAASDAEGVVRQYDAESGTLSNELAAPGFEPYGRASFGMWPLAENEPLVLEIDEKGHHLLDLEQGTVTELDSAPGWVVRTSESGRLLGSMLANIQTQLSTLRFARPTPRPSLEPLLHLVLAERADDWVLTRDERRLALLFYPSNQIEIIDLVEQRVVRVLDAPEYAASMDVSPDERYLAVGGAAVWVYDLETGERTATEKRFDNNVGQVTFSPGGETLVVTAYDGRARSFAFANGALGARQVLSHRGTANVYAAEFSADGRHLVTSSGDRTLKVWQRQAR